MVVNSNDDAVAEEEEEGKQPKIDMVQFIDEYNTNNDGDETIMHQILEAITFKDPSKVFTFHIDYNSLLVKMKTFIMGLNDFNTFFKKI